MQCVVGHCRDRPLYSCNLRVMRSQSWPTNIILFRRSMLRFQVYPVTVSQETLKNTKITKQMEQREKQNRLYQFA